MNKQTAKFFEVDKTARAARRRAPRTVRQTQLLELPSGGKFTRNHKYETSLDDSETRQVLAAAAKSFVATVAFYKSECGGSNTHEDALEETKKNHEWRRGCVEGLAVEETNWGHLAAIAEVNTDDCFKLWSRVREAADDELQSGKRGAKVAGENTTPYSFAQYLAIRDSFADQWQPQGGIESAMIEMLAVSYSLQMYWSTIAHERAIRIHDGQREAIKRFEASRWKSPYQSEADAIDQAHRLADGYNRQFLRVLRQLRDLRRYAPVVIQNAAQVNVGHQQINVSG